MFPVSIEGEIELPAGTIPEPEHTLAALERAVANARPTTVGRSGNAIVFTAGMFRWVTNWNILAPVESGRIEVDPRSPNRITYHFACVRLLVLASLAALLFAVASFGDGGLGVSMLSAGFVWGWLFGMNYLVAALRLPALIRRATRHPG